MDSKPDLSIAEQLANYGESLTTLLRRHRTFDLNHASIDQLQRELNALVGSLNWLGGHPTEFTNSPEAEQFKEEIRQLQNLSNEVESQLSRRAI